MALVFPAGFDSWPLDRQESFLKEKLNKNKDRAQNLLDSCSHAPTTGTRQAAPVKIPFLAHFKAGVEILRFFNECNDIRVQQLGKDRKFMKYVHSALFDMSQRHPYSTGQFKCPCGLAYVLSNIFCQFVLQGSSYQISYLLSNPEVLRAIVVPWSLVPSAALVKQFVETVASARLPMHFMTKFTIDGTPERLLELVVLSPHFRPSWLVENNLIRDVLTLGTRAENLDHLGLSFTLNRNKSVQFAADFLGRLITYTDADVSTISDMLSGKSKTAVPDMKVHHKSLENIMRQASSNMMDIERSHAALRCLTWLVMLEYEPFNESSKLNPVGKADAGSSATALVPPKKADAELKVTKHLVSTEYGKTWFQSLLGLANTVLYTVDDKKESRASRDISVRYLLTLAELYETFGLVLDFPQLDANALADIMFQLTDFTLALIATIKTNSIIFGAFTTAFGHMCSRVPAGNLTWAHKLAGVAVKLARMVADFDKQIAATKSPQDTAVTKAKPMTKLVPLDPSKEVVKKPVGHVKTTTPPSNQQKQLTEYRYLAIKTSQQLHDARACAKVCLDKVLSTACIVTNMASFDQGFQAQFMAILNQAVQKETAIKQRLEAIKAAAGDTVKLANSRVKNADIGAGADLPVAEATVDQLSPEQQQHYQYFDYYAQQAAAYASHFIAQATATQDPAQRDVIIQQAHYYTGLATQYRDSQQKLLADLQATQAELVKQAAEGSKQATEAARIKAAEEARVAAAKAQAQQEAEAELVRAALATSSIAAALPTASQYYDGSDADRQRQVAIAERERLQQELARSQSAPAEVERKRQEVEQQKKADEARRIEIIQQANKEKRAKAEQERKLRAELAELAEQERKLKEEAAKQAAAAAAASASPNDELQRQYNSWMQVYADDLWTAVTLAAKQGGKLTSAQELHLATKLFHLLQFLHMNNFDALSVVTTHAHTLAAQLQAQPAFSSLVPLMHVLHNKASTDAFQMSQQTTPFAQGNAGLSQQPQLAAPTTIAPVQRTGSASADPSTASTSAAIQPNPIIQIPEHHLAHLPKNDPPPPGYTEAAERIRYPDVPGLATSQPAASATTVTAPAGPAPTSTAQIGTYPNVPVSSPAVPVSSPAVPAASPSPQNVDPTAAQAHSIAIQFVESEISAGKVQSQDRHTRYQDLLQHFYSQLSSPDPRQRAQTIATIKLAEVKAQYPTMNGAQETAFFEEQFQLALAQVTGSSSGLLNRSAQ